MPEPTESRQRRAAQSQADRARQAARLRQQHTAAQRRTAWRIGGALVALAVVAALVVVLVGRSPARTPAAPPASGLRVHTLVRLPAASALARGDGGAWVTDDLRDRLMAVNPVTGRTGASVHLPGRPVALLLVGPDLWVAEMVTNTVEEYAASNLHKVRTVAVPTGPSGLAVLGQQVWVASVIANVVTPIDADTGTVGPSLAVPGGAVRLAAGFGSLWVTGTQDALTEVSPGVHGTGPVLPPITVGQGPIGVAVGDGAVWVADATSGDVARVDPATRAVSHTYHVGGDPLGVAVAGRQVYVSDGKAQTLRTVFPTPGAKAVTLGSTPRALLVVGTGLWVAGANPGLVLSATLG